MSIHPHQKHDRPTYLTRMTEAALEARAKEEGIAKRLLIRRYIREGLERPASPWKAGEHEPQGVFLVSGGIPLEGRQIERLEDRAVEIGCTTAELIRRLMAEGLALPPKEQAMTRLQEIEALKASHAAFRQRAQEAADPFLATAAKIKDEIAAELAALRACCRHPEIIELNGATAVYGCPCSDVEHLRHRTKAGLCQDCGASEGACIGDEDYRRFAPRRVRQVGYEEFAQRRDEFRRYLDDH